MTTSSSGNSNNNKNKKYKLFKAEDGDTSIRPCAFFLSEKGCMNGSKCKFSHTSVAPPNINASSSSVVSSESSSAVSSESSTDGLENTTVTTMTSNNNNNNSNGKKRKNESLHQAQTNPYLYIDSSNPFAMPKLKSPGMVKKAKNGNNDNNNANVISQQQQQAETIPMIDEQQPPQKKKKKKSKTTVTPNKNDNGIPNKSSSFRELLANFPIATFSCHEDKTTPQTPNTPSSSNGNTQRATTPNNKEQDQPETKKFQPKYVLPKSTPEGLKWMEACLATRSHPKYTSHYNFDRYQKLDQEQGRTGPKHAWFKTKPFGPWCASNPQSIAIDCEMCETRDPVTGASDPKALCRISIINASNPSEILLDTLVKPDWPVVDHRARINGITRDHLQSVQFTLQHAQDFMQALCSEETIIIGHALHNDLVALKMDHHCNVDSSFLFEVKDQPNATCSLKDLAYGTLNKDMPETHDSVNDARTSLECIEEGYMKSQGKPQPIERVFYRGPNGTYTREPSSSSSTPHKSRGASQLFVHRVPRVCTPEHVHSMFLAQSHVAPYKVHDIEFGAGPTGKVYVDFITATHASLAFDAIATEAKPDKTGRMQKKVFLRNGDYVQVRMMIKTRNSIGGGTNHTSAGKNVATNS
eukprot:CAMPEP_0184856558 /NCGR_PEP_ID=MMETSP0580-20130426/1745_1 /TAXON_ID=1118495 /ORGANISM="Dactyliosolen fragilissimus" /LENGTH=638 /DNA_ID=CAMNT_0027351659 /DNA_START=32 /DNA_END=1948 /DNA_ORIENTATION=+